MSLNLFKPIIHRIDPTIYTWGQKFVNDQIIATLVAKLWSDTIQILDQDIVVIVLEYQSDFELLELQFFYISHQIHWSLSQNK